MSAPMRVRPALSTVSEEYTHAHLTRVCFCIVHHCVTLATCRGCLPALWLMSTSWPQSLKAMRSTSSNALELESHTRLVVMFVV